MTKNRDFRIFYFVAALAILAVFMIIGCGGSDDNNSTTGPGGQPLEGYFVSPSGNDDNPGTQESPFRTIQAALDYAAQQAEPATVHIAAGLYEPTQSLNLRGGISMRGGYDPDTWTRDLSMYKTVIEGDPDRPVISGYHQSSIIVDGFVIKAANATEVTDPGAPGNSSVAIALDSCFAVTFSNDSVVAGNGSAGVMGETGPSANENENGWFGADGGFCPNAGGVGGRGEYFGGDGADGGVTGGLDGNDGYGPEGGIGGSGGPLAHDGTDGTNGGSGNAGTDGLGGASFGSLDIDMYIPANGEFGDHGTSGSGGGGGGSGGGSIAGLCGGGGGGGGGGGWYGNSGYYGGGGGASIGFIVGNYTNATINSTTIITGDGGRGGAGGDGSPGGSGGRGGVGGNSGIGTGAGGHGGHGGDGGRGGHGGGGGGGPVIGIFESFESRTTLDGNITVLGTPGVGGTSRGNAGADGAAEEYLKLTE